MHDTAQRVQLASPCQDGSLSLERCVLKRRSVRSFSNQALSKNELGQLLWAAQGVTGPEGERTVPSAGALYPLELYVIAGNVTMLMADVYRYLVTRHELHLTVPGFQRERFADATLGQDWIVVALACICIAAAFERTTVKYGNRGHRYVYLEAGHAAESLMLQAVALGLGTTMVGAFSDEKVSRLLRLGTQETPLSLIPVGRP